MVRKTSGAEKQEVAYLVAEHGILQGELQKKKNESQRRDIRVGVSFRMFKRHDSEKTDQWLL
jgi:hypothetical protein